MQSVLVTVICVIFLHGCISKPPQGDIALLAFLAGGKTQRTEIILRLGKPSSVFQEEQILTYRLGGNEKDGYYILKSREGWTQESYSLVLVLDEYGILLSHALVRVR